MLRNIPNKVDLVSGDSGLYMWMLALLTIQSLLKNIVDETSFGRYDFMYLRIGELLLLILYTIVDESYSRINTTDFANNCKLV